MMKKINYCLFVLIILFSCKKDNNGTTSPLILPIYFSADGELYQSENCTLISKDNNIIFCIYSHPYMSIFKISKAGNLIWRKDYHLNYNAYSFAITQSNNQDIYISGSAYIEGNSYDALLIKVNSMGDTVWTKTYGGVAAELSNSIIATSDGNILMAGSFYDCVNSIDCINLIKVNPNGDSIWSKYYNPQDKDFAEHLMETQNGEYLITGKGNYINGPQQDLYLLKVNSNGEQLWDKHIAYSPYWNWGNSTIELSNGDLVNCGFYQADGNLQGFLVKTDNLGNVIWKKEYGDANHSEELHSIKQNADGSYIVLGNSRDNSINHSYIMLLKVDANGNQIFLKRFDGSGYDYGMSIFKDINDDNIILGGHNNSFFMSRTDKNGFY